MTPFLEFRVWLRRGPAAERALAGAAAVLGLALAAWTLVPVRGDAVDEAATVTAGADAATGTPAGAAPASSAGSLVEAPASGDGPAPDLSAAPGGAAGSTGAAAAAGAPSTGAAGIDRCAALGAPDQGVTDEEVLVAVPILALGGDVGNSTFGIRGDLEAVANAAAAGINAEGGVACRKLVIKIYRVNPLNQNEQRSKCLEIAEAKPFAVIDFGSYLDPVSRACFTQNKLPYQGALAITEKEAANSFPYMYTASASADRQLRSWVFAAAERGTFDTTKGFKKLGLLLNSCEPGINDELVENLASVGVGRDELSTFTLGCTPVSPPNQLAQAALQHRQDGATHVLFGSSQASAQSYVRSADQVRYRPTYLASDFGAVSGTTSQDGWSDGFDGTIAITSLRGGELNSGIRHKLVQPCRAWYERAKVPAPEKDGDATFFFCTVFRLFKAAADATGPNLTRATLLADGLPKVGRFESATHGDAVFDRRGKVTGGDTVRAIQWRIDCRCWKVLDDMKPAR